MTRTTSNDAGKHARPGKEWKQEKREKQYATNETRPPTFQSFFLLKSRFRVTSSGSSSAGRRYPFRGWNIRWWSPWCVLGAVFPSNVLSTYEAPCSPPKSSMIKGPRHFPVSFPSCGVETLSSTKSPGIKYCVLTPLSYRIKKIF